MNNTISQKAGRLAVALQLMFASAGVAEAQTPGRSSDAAAAALAKYQTCERAEYSKTNNLVIAAERCLSLLPPDSEVEITVKPDGSQSSEIRIYWQTNDPAKIIAPKDVFRDAFKVCAADKADKMETPVTEEKLQGIVKQCQKYLEGCGCEAKSGIKDGLPTIIIQPAKGERAELKREPRQNTLSAA